MVTRQMQFRVLGPVVVEVGGRSMRLPRRQERAVLAVLLLEAGQVIPVPRLAGLLWPEGGPVDPRPAIHTYVSRLRTALAAVDASGHGIELARRGDGYLIEADRAVIDAHQFADLVKAARAVPEASRRAALLRRALGLWRGPALADVGEHLRGVLGARLELLRRAALEACLEAEVGGGASEDLVGELTELVAADPGSERLAGLLMRALSQIGRRVDALEVYRRTRAHNVEELGLEPGDDLQELHRRILAGGQSAAGDPPAAAGPPGAGDPSADAAAGTLAVAEPPRQLLAAAAGFTGRVEELALLEKALLGVDAGNPVVISAIDGAGGVGKSALAIHAAHRLAEAFPDGQLYVDLQGATAGLAPLEPGEVLGRFLRALGLSGSQIPAQPDEAAAVFRTRLAGRRVLLVLDNAVDEAQVRPLLPGTPGCGVLVTSRRALFGLDGTTHLHLDVLTPADSLALLGRLVGAERLAAEPEAAAQVTRHCGYLPLALRIAGARLVARPQWPVAALADRLSGQDRRLDELELVGAGVRISFDVSYQHLRDSADQADRAAAAALALLGVWDVPDIALPVAACLLDRSPVETERILERLVDAALLEAPAPGRYQPHDLIRLYAREQAIRSCPEPDRHAALERVLRYYTSTTWHTLAVLRPGDFRLGLRDERWSSGGLQFTGAAAALDWLEDERANLPAVVDLAAAVDQVAAAATQLRTPCSASLSPAGSRAGGSRLATPRWRSPSGPVTVPLRRRWRTTSASRAACRGATGRRGSTSRRRWPCIGTWATWVAKRVAWATWPPVTGGCRGSTTHSRACMKACGCAGG